MIVANRVIFGLKFSSIEIRYLLKMFDFGTFTLIVSFIPQVNRAHETHQVQRCLHTRKQPRNKYGCTRGFGGGLESIVVDNCHDKHLIRTSQSLLGMTDLSMATGNDENYIEPLFLALSAMGHKATHVHSTKSIAPTISVHVSAGLLARSLLE